MGPTLFLIYINDLPGALENVACTIFADDTTLSVAQESLEGLSELCEGMQSRAELWFTSNNLLLNREKTVKITFLTRDLT